MYFYSACHSECCVDVCYFSLEACFISLGSPKKENQEEVYTYIMRLETDRHRQTDFTISNWLIDNRS